MKHTDPNPNDNASSGWQLLGELKVSNASNTENTIQVWLLEILTPFNLPTDFLTKIKKAIIEAVLNLIESTVQGHDHIHLLIFIRREETSGPRAWGFFRIEKLEDTTQEKLNHAIEFYLYPDG